MSRETGTIALYDRTANSAASRGRRSFATAIVVLLLAGLWSIMRWPMQQIIAKSSIGEPDRSAMMLDALRAMDPAAASFELPMYHSRMRGQPAFIFVPDRVPRGLAPSDPASSWMILDETFRVRGSIRDDLIFVPQMSIPFVDRDGDGFCELLCPVAGGIHGELVFAAVLRVKETNLELVGCMRADSLQSSFPDCEATWNRSAAGAMQGLNFVERRAPANAVRRTISSGPRIAARSEWTRPGGVLKQVLEGGAATVNCFPGDRPIQLPYAVNVRQFLDDQYPRSETTEVSKPDW